MARVRLCVCGSWFVGREGQAAHPRAPGQCLHFECRGAPARVRAWRCEGRPPLPHHFVCVETFTLPTLPYLCGGEGGDTHRKHDAYSDRVSCAITDVGRERSSSQQ